MTETEEKSTKTSNITDNNKKTKDNTSRIIFEDPILCAQFIRDYVKIPELANVRPEDIEDVTERYLPLFTSERESDVVKRIRLDNENPIFLLSLIEHKTKVDYNVIMQLLRYMCFIWDDYEKEMQKISDQKLKESGDPDAARERGAISSHKDFKYPPILPIVYFEAAGKWTAVMNLKDRIHMSDVFGKYLPDFTYELIRLHDYSNVQLMEKNDEMSLIMLLGKLKTLADLQGMGEVREYCKDLLKQTPQHLIDIIGKVTTILLNRMRLPQDEIDEFLDLIKERKMPELFECFEKVDVPKMREEIQAEREEIQVQREEIQAERAEIQAEKQEIQAEKQEIQAEKQEIQAEKQEIQAEKQEIQAEKQEIQAEKQEIQSRQQEIQSQREKLHQEKADLRDSIIVENICKMFYNGCSIDMIADILGEDSQKVHAVCQLAESMESGHDLQAIWEAWKKRG